METLHAHQRFTFGIPALGGGVDLIPAMVGAFGLAEILGVMKRTVHARIVSSGDRVVPKLSEILKYWRTTLRSGIIGTFVGNPLSWPFIWVSTYVMGLQIVGLEGAFDPAAVERNVMLLWGALADPSPQLFDATAALLWPLLWPMLAGSVPIGLLTAAIVYYISRNVVRGWRLRIMNRAPDAAE